MVEIFTYKSFDQYIKENGDSNLFLATTKAPRDYSAADMSIDAKLCFGKETKGLPEDIRDRYPEGCIRLPMIDDARSLNLSNAVAVLCYEALRQQGFPGLR